MSFDWSPLLGLDVIRSLKEHVTCSPSRTDEVDRCSKAVLQQIKFGIRKTASDTIIRAMRANEFGTDTEAHQAAMGVYMLDKNLFEFVFNDVFRVIGTQEFCPRIRDMLNKFENHGALAYAFYSLLIYGHSENLYYFRGVASYLLKQPELEPEERNKARELLNSSIDAIDQYMDYQAAINFWENMRSW